MQQSSLQFMSSLVDDIIDLSRLEFNKFELIYEWFKIKELVTEIVQLAQFQADQKKIQIQTQISNRVPYIIYADRKRIKQIIINLLTNAIKFTFEGYVMIEIDFFEQNENHQQQEIQGERNQEEEKKEINAFQSQFQNRLVLENRLEHVLDASSAFQMVQSCEIKQFLKISVIDSGIGISVENQSQLFKLFGMVKSTQNLNKQGVGLGLTICKRFCEQMGGNIQVQSQIGQGTTFFLTIQIQESLNDNQLQGEDSESFEIFEEAQLEDLVSEKLAAVSYMQSERQDYSTNLRELTIKCNSQRIDFVQFDKEEEKISRRSRECSSCSQILIVDDDNFNIMAFQMLLENQFQLSADFANVGSEGLKMMKEKLTKCCCKPYKIIFIDLNMPVMDGIEMKKQIQKEMQAIASQMKLYSNSKFVLCTAQSKDQITQRFSLAELGFQVFLEKPIDLQKLKEIIQKFP